MADGDFIKLAVQYGPFAVVSAVLFYFYRKDVQNYTAMWQSQATLNYQQTQAMMALIERWTAATTENTQVLKALHRRMDRLEILRVVDDGQPDEVIKA